MRDLRPGRWTVLGSAERPPSGIYEHSGLEYVRDEDTMKKPFEAPSVIVNFFYHKEIKKSAKKGAKYMKKNRPEGGDP